MRGITRPPSASFTPSLHTFHRSVSLADRPFVTNVTLKYRQANIRNPIKSINTVLVVQIIDTRNQRRQAL